MIIVIPLGGVGKRFSELGYLDPKPLIKANGKEIIFWLIDNLKIQKKDKIYIVYNHLLEKYNFENIINYKDNRINFFKLPIKTKGPVETVHIFLKEIIDNYFDEKILLLDGDTFYKKNILGLFRSRKKNSIIYFKGKNLKPIYSFIKIKKKRIFNIVEKINISNNANTGAYFFNSVKILYYYASRTLKKYSKKAYISHIYKEMIKDKIIIEPVKILEKDFICLGTPEQLKSFSQNFKDKPKRFCFDLDNTLVSLPKVKNDYTTVEPIYENIKFLKKLKSRGHYIIIYTARRMRTHNSNIKKVIKEIKKLTVKQLKEFGISYDELIFGKPYAHYYIDDLAINPIGNLNFKLGYYDDDEKTRLFNNVIVGEKFTIKKSTNLNKLGNEIKYYKNIPNKLKKYFPKLLNNKNTWYKLETVQGISFEYLFINSLLQTSHLDILFSALNDIHANSKLFADNRFIYKNYKSKTLERLKLLDSKTRKKNNFFFKTIVKCLEEYEINNYGKTSIVHGDPVFSNIIKKEANNIKFIDPRGGYLSKFTIYGDKFYDYSKVYQSLTGYHQIINNKILNSNYLDELINYFENFFVKNFGIDKLKYIKIITTSFYITLIPFHNKKYKEKMISNAKKIFKTI
jgi:capsule biosynthesis phosphatase